MPTAKNNAVARMKQISSMIFPSDNRQPSHRLFRRISPSRPGNIRRRNQNFTTMAMSMNDSFFEGREPGDLSSRSDRFISSPRLFQNLVILQFFGKPNAQRESMKDHLYPSRRSPFGTDRGRG